MVLPACFLSIPALATTVISSGYRVPATLAYAPTNTNYFGATSCGLSSVVSTTLPPSVAQCTLPPSVSGKAYSVTPVVYVPRTVRGDDYARTFDNYTCNPIPAASMNKGNFEFVCKGLRGKNMGHGYHTISWNLPADAGISIKPYQFIAYPPTSTPKYVVNTAKAKTTLVPKTTAVVTTTRKVTEVRTVTATVTTRTTTCFYTVTATPSPVSGRHFDHVDSSNHRLGPRVPVRRAGSADLLPDSDPEFSMSDSVFNVDVDVGYDRAHDDDDSNNNNNNVDVLVELKERAASVTPTIGKPNYTYPPYGVTTIYVKSISTSFYTVTAYSTVFRASPILYTTISVAKWVYSTITVTAAPVPTSTP